MVGAGMDEKKTASQLWSIVEFSIKECAMFSVCRMAFPLGKNNYFFNMLEKRNADDRQENV